MNQAILLNQLEQLKNPDARIALELGASHSLLQAQSRSLEGLQSGDTKYAIMRHWEFPVLISPWARFQTSVAESAHYAGKELFLRFGRAGEYLTALPGYRADGLAARNTDGVVVSQMGSLPVTLGSRSLLDNNSALIIPKDPAYLTAIWCFCSSPAFNSSVRAIDQSLKVTNATLVKVPFDLDYWQKVADERYPDGLPDPHSDDPTQWLFRGDIPSSTNPLQVALAQLLGYRWPDQPDDDLNNFADDDGIVTLTPLVNQEGIPNRLRSLLQDAYESPPPARPKGAPPVEEPREWNEAVIPRLLAKTGSSTTTLEEWLRDRFFDAHTRQFHQRPFIWHIWDGLKDGFHAFVNYHKFDRKNLERLTHVYLGEWIERQKAASETGDRTADGRLAAAQELQRKLELIRVGEPPYDIFVRWKALQEQPIGWEPDLNDGVRMNIRPFVEAGILRSKVNVNWNKDRGKDPKPNVSGAVERHNDLHFTIAQKLEARERSRTQ